MKIPPTNVGGEKSEPNRRCYRPQRDETNEPRAGTGIRKAICHRRLQKNGLRVKGLDAVADCRTLYRPSRSAFHTNSDDAGGLGPENSALCSRVAFPVTVRGFLPVAMDLSGSIDQWPSTARTGSGRRQGSDATWRRKKRGDRKPVVPFC